jgi:Secretion system C-terminal sorting domain
MKIFFLIPVLIITGIGYAQTIYDVTPGTKRNRIIIELENQSTTLEAKNIEVKLTNSPKSLIFNNNIKMVKILKIAETKEEVFSFDIKRNTEINKKDTVKFTINGERISLKKSFIINYKAPQEFALSQNYPNPFNPITLIQYDLPVDSKVILKIYDILGNEVKTLVNEEQGAGFKEIKFDGSSFASGMYIYRLTANNQEHQNFVSIKKMMMIK